MIHGCTMNQGQPVTAQLSLVCPSSAAGQSHCQLRLRSKGQSVWFNNNNKYNSQSDSNSNIITQEIL